MSRQNYKSPIVYDLTLSSSARGAWRDFLSNQKNLGHTKRILVGGDIDSHINSCIKSARATVARVKSDLGNLLPRVILEIGCSAGLNCLALQEAFPGSEVIGLEPEQEALSAAESLRNGLTGRWPRFIRGVGESIPVLDGSVDLILCHTVIEHVRSVPQVITEMARVLSPCGIAHLEAPNYLWPYEPHLEVWTIPKLGKPFVGVCARLQGQGEMVSFLDHLQFVTPFELESLFAKNNLAWHNCTGDKIRAVLAGHGEVKQYKTISRWLGMLGRTPMAEPFARGIVASGLYPSVLYTLRHGSKNEPN